VQIRNESVFLVKMVCRVQIQTHSVVSTYELTKEPILLILLQLLPATSASKRHLNTKTKEEKRNLERSLRYEGNDKSGMDKSQIRAETPHGTVHGFHHRMWNGQLFHSLDKNSVDYVRNLVIDTVY